jgi:SAM-dependent methyltransferase
VVKKADFNQPIPFPDASYEVTFCSHVLEHVDSPLHLLREMRRLLKPDGKAIIAVPVEFSLARVFLRDPFFGGHPEHLYSFSLDCLRRLLEAAGLTEERVILDFPLLKSLQSNALLRSAQLLPTRLGMLLAGNIWIIAARRGYAGRSQ